MFSEGIIPRERYSDPPRLWFVLLFALIPTLAHRGIDELAGYFGVSMGVVANQVSRGDKPKQLVSGSAKSAEVNPRGERS